MSTLTILASQSNGGYKVTPAELPAHITVLPNVQIWNSVTKAWEVMQPGINTGGIKALPNAWGWEVEYGYHLGTTQPDQTHYIIKTLEGGTGLAADASQWDWSPQTGEQYAKSSAIIAEAKAALPHAVPVGDIFWMVGETDASDAGKAAAYATNLASALARIQADWADPGTEFHVARISETWGADNPVRTAQAAYQGYSTDDFQLQADQVHLSGAGQIDAGAHAFASANTTRLTTNGTDANDRLVGGQLDDFIHGGAGDDYIVGGDGFDNLHGNMGNDTLHGGRGDDWVVGGKDNDLLYGAEGNDIVYGNMGDDTCVGGEGNDLIRGGQNNDMLFGGRGDDWLSGDRGDDTISGGAGADTFNAFVGCDLDVITDFNFAEGDRLRIESTDGTTVTQVGADVHVSLGLNSLVVLQGVDLSSLGDGWMI